LSFYTLVVDLLLQVQPKKEEKRGKKLNGKRKKKSFFIAIFLGKKYGVSIGPERTHTQQQRNRY
jgi:hypothetical protein